MLNKFFLSFFDFTYILLVDCMYFTFTHLLDILSLTVCNNFCLTK